MFLSFIGQQIIRLPDGRLQLITIPQQNTAQVVSASSGSNPTVRVIQAQPAQTQVRPQAIVVNTSTGTVSTAQSSSTSGTTAKIVVTPQPGGVVSNIAGGSALVSSSQSSGTVTVISSSGQSIAKIVSPVKPTGQIIQKVGGTPVVAVANTSTGPRVIRQLSPQVVVPAQTQNLQSKQQQLQQQQQVLAQQQAQIQQIQAQLQQQTQVKLASGQVIQVPSQLVQSATSSGTGPQTITVTPQQLAALQQQQQIKVVSSSAIQTASGGDTTKLSQSSKNIQEQLVKQVQGQQTAGEAVKSTAQPDTTVKATPTSPQALVVTSPISKGSQQKYAVTPQVVQEGMLFGFFRLFIVATGCPSERCPQKTVSCYGGVQGYRTKLLRIPPGTLTCSMYSTITWDLGLTSHLKDS